MNRKVIKPIVLCREYDKFEGREPIIYPIEFNFSEGNLKYLSIRARYNPELAYFLVLEDNWKNNKESIKNKILNEHNYDRFDDFIGCFSNTLANNGILRL